MIFSFASLAPTCRAMKSARRCLKTYGITDTGQDITTVTIFQSMGTMRLDIEVGSLAFHPVFISLFFSLSLFTFKMNFSYDAIGEVAWRQTHKFNTASTVAQGLFGAFAVTVGATRNLYPQLRFSNWSERQNTTTVTFTMTTPEHTTGT